MKKYIKKFFFYVTFIYSLAPIVFASNARVPQSFSCSATSTPTSMKSTNKVESKEMVAQVEKAIGFIDSRSSIAEGVRILKDASQQGSDEAKYTLGWLYMQNVIQPSDNDLAFDYLNTVGGEFKTAAKILIGAIYAKGSKKTPPNPEKAKRIFNEVACILNQESKVFQLSEPSTADEIRRRKKWYENGVVLSGIAKEVGVAIDPDLSGQK